ncbi:hypothetical protein GIB67_014315 [Kingdonia uniflora]|uniref:Agenet domain-containing protein n=1 Tax=Kingdonia uniflora TaxID=39325 RepID=A0A7J7NT51_9MAGN|nr:hypothetical protein GIB67_014315 [Kingdonia uniflora]
MGEPHLIKGQIVEVSNDEAFKGSWYTATVVKTSQGKNTVLVEYDYLLDTVKGKLQETLPIHKVRPQQPEESNKLFEINQEIEAFYDDGWWRGVVRNVQENFMHTVYLKRLCEEFDFRVEELRNRWEWSIDGGWKQPQRQVYIVIFIFTYILWHPDNSIFGVWSNANTWQQVLHNVLYILSQVGKNCPLFISDGITKSGVVGKETEGQHLEGAVGLKTRRFSRIWKKQIEAANTRKIGLSKELKKTNVILVQLEHPSGQLLGLEHQTPTTEITNVLEKEFASKKNEICGTKMLNDFENEHQPLSVWPHEYFPSPVMDNAENSSHSVDEHNEAILQSTGKICDARAGEPNETIQSLLTNPTPTAATFSPLTQEDGVLQENDSFPFVKSLSIWTSFESMEAFILLPQHPHFRPLEGKNKNFREGSAIGWMFNFSNLVYKTRNACIEDHACDLKEMLEALIDLEKYGFNIQPLHSRLEELLKIKEILEKNAEEMKEVERKIATLSKLEVDIKQLEQQIAEMNEKRQSLMRERNIKESVADLKMMRCSIQESDRRAKLKFASVVAASW